MEALRLQLRAKSPSKEAWLEWLATKDPLRLDPDAAGEQQELHKGDPSGHLSPTQENRLRLVHRTAQSGARVASPQLLAGPGGAQGEVRGVRRQGGGGAAGEAGGARALLAGCVHATGGGRPACVMRPAPALALTRPARPRAARLQAPPANWQAERRALMEQVAALQAQLTRQGAHAAVDGAAGGPTSSQWDQGRAGAAVEEAAGGAGSGAAEEGGEEEGEGEEDGGVGTSLQSMVAYEELQEAHKQVRVCRACGPAGG